MNKGNNYINEYGEIIRTYENYMGKQPMRDGEEMRNFFDELNNNKKKEAGSN